MSRDALADLLEWTASPVSDRATRRARFRALLDASGERTRPERTVKVTGTNGKGSCCAMLEAALRRAELRVGLFTSPHLFHVAERFRVDGQDVDEAVLQRHAGEVAPIARDLAAQRGETFRPALFEVLVIVALRVFREAGVEVAIFEGGVGGDNDPVGQLPGVLSLITNVAFDHVDLLGPTLESIAADKAGMASDGAHLVIGPSIAPSLRDVIEAAAGPRGVGVHQAGRAGIRAARRGHEATRVEIDEPEAEGPIRFELPLLGEHQIDNLATVVAAVERLVKEGVIPSLDCLRGIEETRWAGRAEVVGSGPRFVLDVAHNEDGMRALAALVDDLAPREARVLLYGAGTTKDYAACLPYLSRLSERVYLVDGFHNAASAEALAAGLPEGCRCAGRFSSVDEAIAHLRRMDAGATVIVTGSVFLVGEARHRLRSAPPVPDSLGPLFALPKFGSGVGLHRMLGLCDEVLEGEWARGLDAIKVTGSNGKGSVCAMTAAILGALGVATGVYTSPHLLRFHERIALAGEPIADGDLDAAARWCVERCERYRREHPDDAIGAFEAFTALALHHYASKRPEALVVEAGIGGRYDSTRVVPGQITALTSLDLEHTAALGSTLEMIAYDKADLCPAGGALVVGPIDPEVLRRLRAYARVRGIEVIAAEERSTAGGIRFEGGRMIVDLEVDGLRLGELMVALPGHHQVANATVAIMLALRWMARHRPETTAREREAAIRNGLAAVRWPGRFERVCEAPEVIIDVGHSPDAIAKLITTVRAALAGRRILLVTGVSHDKAVEPIVEQLVTVADRVIATRAHHKGAPVERIAGIVRRAAPGIPCTAEATIEGAMARAIEHARREGMTVLVAGGLFLAIEAMVAARGEDPRALRFF